MSEKDDLEAQLSSFDEAAAIAGETYSEAIEALRGVLGTNDAPRIRAATDDLELAKVMYTNVSDSRREIQRRLEHLAAIELAHEETAASKSATRAAWATFWAAVVALVVTTATAIVVAVIASTSG